MYLNHYKKQPDMLSTILPFLSKVDIYINGKFFVRDLEMNQFALFYLLADDLEFELAFDEIQMQKAYFHQEKIRGYLKQPIKNVQLRTLAGDIIKEYESHIILS